MTPAADDGGESPSLLPAGRRIASRYEIVESLGEGATGIVYLARRTAADGKDEGAVALKVIHRHLCGDRQIFGRFRREAAILKRIEGDHVAKLLDAIEEDGLLVLALEYVEGPSLEKLLHDRGPLSLDEAVELTLQICAALGAAHAAGVVHRDLKPSNVLIERRGSRRLGARAGVAEADGRGGTQPRAGGADEGEARSGSARVRVVDFGLAKVVHGDKAFTGLTEHDMIFGTPEYMAPEQARGEEADARCDIYAAGIMLYEMAVGRVPFRGRTPLASMTAHLAEEPPPPRSVRPDRGVSPALEAVILRALAKDPAQRFPSARAFAEALAGARDEPLVIAPDGPGDRVSIGTRDTELHLDEQAAAVLAHSATVPGDVISPLAGRRDPPSRTRIVVSEGTQPLAATEYVDSRPPPNASRWVWAAVAVVAAAIGVLIGVLAGTR